MQDLRYALRTLRLNPIFTSVAVISLALAIGVNTMIFSVVHGILLQPLPFVEPDRLVEINEANPSIGVARSAASYANLRDWRERSRSFAAIAGLQGRSLAIADRQDPERYEGAAISWNLFSMLGVPPALGRDFVAADDQPGAAPVTLLSDEMWRLRYDADRTIIGRSLLVNGQPHTIVGVMPPNFEFPQNQKIWIPLAPLVSGEARDRRSVAVFARLAPGVTHEAAQGEMGAVAGVLARELAAGGERWTAIVRSIKDDFIPEDVRLILLTMMGAVTLVLVVACANVANLMLARSAARRREMSIRAAIGAGRARLSRQLLTEAVTLALLAVPPGVALAYAGNALVRRSIPPDDIPYLIQWDINLTVLAYTIALAVTTGVLFGLAPALQTRSLNLQSALKEGGRGTGGVSPRTLLRSALVTCEVALALVLLVGASLFVRSFLNIRAADAGFDIAPLMTLRLYMTGEAYAAEDARARRGSEIAQRIESLPGVAAAFASNLVPLDGGGDDSRIAIEGRSWPEGEEPYVGFTGVTPHIFATLNVTVTRGRSFADGEGLERRPVAVVNETMASRFWPGDDVVGRQFRLRDSGIADAFTIIGVVPDIRHNEVEPGDERFPQAYVPYPYAATPNTGLTIRITGPDPTAITAAVREEIRRIDAQIPLFSVRSMAEVQRVGSWQYAMFGWLFTAFGAVALMLAVTGVYGLLSYAVSQRTQEIGVRVALGAARRDIIALIVGQGLRLTVVGIVVGLVAAVGVTQVIAALLYNVSASDPLTFLATPAFLAIVALLASYLPTRRATAVDPLIALRSD